MGATDRGDAPAFVDEMLEFLDACVGYLLGRADAATVAASGPNGEGPDRCEFAVIRAAVGCLAAATATNEGAAARTLERCLGIEGSASDRAAMAVVGHAIDPAPGGEVPGLDAGTVRQASIDAFLVVLAALAAVWNMDLEDAAARVRLRVQLAP